jgi:CheY-like chemotaxis protein
MKPLKRILLIEDSDSDAELALHALAEHSLANKVLHLHDGAQALDYLFRRGEFTGLALGNPRVALLDLKMPKVDGMEVLRRIKGEPALGTIPVVVMTSSREDRDVHAAYRLGANAYRCQTHEVRRFRGCGQAGGRALGDPERAAARRNARGRRTPVIDSSKTR